MTLDEAKSAFLYELIGRLNHAFAVAVPPLAESSARYQFAAADDVLRGKYQVSQTKWAEEFLTRIFKAMQAQQPPTNGRATTTPAVPAQPVKR